MNKQNKVVVITGETATGKSSIAYEYAKQNNGHIINCDSMQIYRKFDIGTAKSSKQEMLVVNHHLYDIRSFDDQIYSVHDYYSDLINVINNVLSQGHLPIVCGGTGLYVSTLYHGPVGTPRYQASIRQKWLERCEKEGVEKIYSQLRSLDPKYAKTITYRDKQKIIRAMEIIDVSKKRVSDFEVNQKKKDYDFDVLYLYLTRDRENLKKRINTRCKSMIKSGLREEVSHLKSQGLTTEHIAGRAVGYRQVLENMTLSDQDLCEQISSATRQYAKRQRTWFNSVKHSRYLDKINIDECAMQDVFSRIDVFRDL
jgi:tRNA dimethylallyltransferase